MPNPLFFCNIAWMDRYVGVTKADKPRGGGLWVDENEHAHEACNFLICDDGNVYGHFETSKGEIDREVRLERLGANADEDSVSGVDVIWTAPLNGNGARHVVGWYRNATVYRNRSDFVTVPSTQHKVDKLKNFRVMAKAEDATLLPLNKRTLELGRGQGWSGQASWWYVEESTNPEVPAFLDQLRALMDGMLPAASATKSKLGKPSANGTALEPYLRYVQAFEIEISPAHGILQQDFAAFVEKAGAEHMRHDLRYVDFRYNDKLHGGVFCEVKPCSRENARFAIRHAIGQLLDYKQREKWTGKMLIVLGSEPADGDDKLLAIENGFNLAWRNSDKSFAFSWLNE